ncbi:hypothetical protein [Microbacterium album]|uniref:Uncharacterized protein n=1 Tax=Microbacterium album TaxID=2053191 RepID=A0A917IDL3_9MICO|nr:hypothetical protein [Microbacterium album]GGH38439.1 hypothetical protein GCM10010921_09000 [Microbacterium album]
MHDLGASAVASLATSLAVATPTTVAAVDPDLVTPGPAGFAVIGLLVVLLVVLAGDMLRRVRRARYRQEAQEALDAEEAAARGDQTGTEGDDSPAGR